MVTENSIKGRDERANETTNFYERMLFYIKEHRISLEPDDWLSLEAICCKLDSILADDVMMLAVKNEKTFDNCIRYYRPRRAVSGDFSPQQSKKVQKIILYHLNKLATISSHHVAIAMKVTEKEDQEIFLSKASALAESIEDHLEIVFASIETSIDYNKMIKIAEDEIKKAASLSRSPKDEERILTAVSDVNCAFFLKEDLKAIANKAIAERTPIFTQKSIKDYMISQE